MHHVIVGAGPAGVIAAETLRKVDSDAKITLLGDEPEPPYSRMALPYYLIDKVGESGTHLRHTNGHFSNLNIEVRQERVETVKPAEKKLALKGGGEMSYDKLLIATGSSPMTPPIPGIELDRVHNCWTLEDARKIASLASPGAKVVLIGAGFIGSIILEALASRKVDLSVVEMENRMVPRMMDDASGGLIKSWCEAKGVKVYTSARVDRINSGSAGTPLEVRLEGGTVLPADLVISATGVRPNLEALIGSGVKTDTGLLVNDCMQTSDPNIYAAGDVAQGKDFSTGEYSIQAIQPTAADHGRTAALNMAGRQTKHRGCVNMNVLDTLGLISSSFGMWMGVDGGESATSHNPDAYEYLNLQFKDDVLVGASSLGLTEHVGVVRGLIQSQVKLGPWKDKLMAEPNRLMEAYIARTQSIGHNASVI